MVKLNSSPDLKIRAFSSVFIVAVIVCGIAVGGMFWDIIAALAALISMYEFYRLSSGTLNSSGIISMIAGFVIIAGASLKIMNMSSVVCSISVAAFVALFIEVIRRQATGKSHAIESLSSVVGGIAYIALPWTFMILLREMEFGRMFLFTLFFCTWCCDVAAYFVGSNLGRFKLCDKVSPKKTWEGFLGGVAASIACGGLMALIFRFPPLPLLLLGAVCGIAGQLGDLCESVIKREAGVKDTGHIIPGHGGFLDRFDSILINSALAFVIFELIG